MKALVISGGGSKGAFAGGVAEYLIKDQKNNYDLFIGSSTGSLLTPLLAANNFEKAKEAYLNIKEENVFKRSPFVFIKEDGKYIRRYNRFSMMQNLFQEKKSFGDSSPLKQYILNIFSEDDFLKIRALGREVIVTVSNLTKQTIEFKSSNEENYLDFCDWIWASASVLPFMTLVQKDNCEYGDGSFGRLIPLNTAVRRGAKEIDAIILRPEHKEVSLPKISNVFEVMARTFDFMYQQVAKDDILLGQMAADKAGIKINYFYTPRLLTENSFVFDPEQMRAWWEEGYLAFKHQPSD